WPAIATPASPPGWTTTSRNPSGPRRFATSCNAASPANPPPAPPPEPTPMPTSLAPQGELVPRADSALLDRVLVDAFLEKVHDFVYFKDRQSRYIALSKSLVRCLGCS